MVRSAQRFAPRQRLQRLHRVQVPVRGHERLPRLRVLRIAADFLLAVEVLAASFDGVLEDAAVDVVAIPRTRTDIRDHDVAQTNYYTDIIAHLHALPQTQVDLTPVLTAISGLSAQLTQTRSDILAAIGTPQEIDLPYWPGLANVTLGAPQAISGDVEIMGPMDGLLVELTNAPEPTKTWTCFVIASADPTGGRIGLLSFGEPSPPVLVPPRDQVGIGDHDERRMTT